MSIKRWNLLPPANSHQLKRLSQDLNIDPLYVSLLLNRGISSFEEAKNFFLPSLLQLPSPFLLKDINQAVDRIDRAIKQKEKILIYGDYDVDGTTAVALLYSFLRKNTTGNLIDFYIPDRNKEGYGVSSQGIDFAIQHQFKLIIALDCGIRAIQPVRKAKQQGIDFILCDHHLPGKELPPAVAILNPKQEGCSYPYKHLSGCGIGYKLVCALEEKWNLSPLQNQSYLDLVATSIAADVVPVTGENRILAYHGLKKLNEQPSVGIKALIDSSGLTDSIDIRDVAFMLAPRINVAGRLAHARLAVELLLADDLQEAKRKAYHLSQLNDQRKTLDRNICKEILRQIQTDECLQDRKTTVLYSPHWNKGVIGIAASKVMETYYRPTVILTESNGKATGSARSVKGFNIHQALSSCASLFSSFGGHAFAAGMTLELDKIKAFQEKFESIVSQSIREEDLVPLIEIEKEINFSDINSRFFNTLQRFEPFGPQNKQPIFMTRRVVNNGYSRIMGIDHLRLELIQPGFKEESIVGIGFNLAEKFPLVESSSTFDICYSIEPNKYSGKHPYQLRIWDIKESEDPTINQRTSIKIQK